MRKSIALMLGEVQGIMSGYATLMNYRFMNLCVKAEPASLLSLTVEYDSERYNIEKVAGVSQPNEKQLQVFPQSPELLPAICLAIAKTHPEFKQEIVNFEPEDEDGVLEGVPESEAEADEEDKTILLTMPTVNKDRHDLLVTAVDGLYDETKAKIDVYFGVYAERLAAKLKHAAPEEMDEAKQGLESVRDEHKDLLKQCYESKKQEIEDAYQRYLTQQQTVETAQQEEEAATSKEVGQGFKFAEMDEAPGMPDAPEMPGF